MKSQIELDVHDYLRDGATANLCRQFGDFAGLASRTKYSLDIFVNSGIDLEVNTMMDRSFFVCGSSGSGKSNFVRVMLEELLGRGIACVVFDIEGEYKSLANMYPKLNVIGGNMADGSRRVPELDPSRGEEWAKAALFGHKSFIFDLSADDGEAQAEFAASFLTTLDNLARAQPLEGCTDYCAVFVEESQRLYPQRTSDRPDVEKDTMKALQVAITNLAKMGRKRHVSLWLITQRPQAINKDALTQVSVIFAFRLGHPLDYCAVGRLIGLSDKRCSLIFPILKPGQGFYAVGDEGFRKGVQVRLSRSRHLARSANTVEDYEEYLKRVNGG